MLPLPTSCADYENLDGMSDEPLEPVRISGVGTIHSRTLPVDALCINFPMVDSDYVNQDVIDEDIIPFQLLSDAGSAASFEFLIDQGTVPNQPVPSSVDLPTSKDRAPNQGKVLLKQQMSSDTLKSEDSSNFSSGSSTASSPTLQTKHNADEVDAMEQASKRM